MGERREKAKGFPHSFIEFQPLMCGISWNGGSQYGLPSPSSLLTGSTE